MKSVHATLRINPEIVGKLGSGTGAFWSAAHPDGSDNRIDADAVLEAGSYGIPLGILSALFQGIRKKYRNQGKTKEDLLEEKEAAKINRTGGALEEMLLEYIRAASGPGRRRMSSAGSGKCRSDKRGSFIRSEYLRRF